MTVLLGIRKFQVLPMLPMRMHLLYAEASSDIVDQFEQPREVSRSKLKPKPFKEPRVARRDDVAFFKPRSERRRLNYSQA